MRKNILHIMNYAANYRGNFIDSLETLNGELSESNRRNIYIFSHSAQKSEASEWIEALRSDGRAVYYLTEHFLSNVKILRQIIKREQIGVVHTHFISMQQFLFVKFAAKRSGVKIVMHFHNHAVPFSNPLKSALRRFIYRKCVMIGVSESVADGLKFIYPKNKVYEVSNAINFSRLDKYEKLNRNDYEAEEGSLLCLMFGFDYFRKGVDLAVQAVNALIKKGKKITLLISLSANEESVRKNIMQTLGEFPAWIRLLKARNDVASYYCLSDVFISPSREEGFCYSLIEAAYCGCRVIASKIPAQGQLKIPDAVWFESQNAMQLSERIENIRIEKSSPSHEEIKKFLMKEYDLTQWAKQVIEIYDEINV